MTRVAETSAGVWELALPWSKPPLSLNDRRHWRVRAREVAEVRQTTAWLLTSRKIPKLHRCRVTLHYRPRDKRVRDTENPVATVKACCDAIVDARIVPDDRPEFMVKEMPVIHPPGSPATWLTIESLPPPEETS